MKHIDINCDLGELADGSDLQIMPYISSCNIACGGHAGDPDLMLKAVQEAFTYHVTIGAHPGYVDRANFGRKSMNLSATEISMLVFDQISRLQNIASNTFSSVRYVKLHGALYHDASEDVVVAGAVIEGIRKTGMKLSVLGPGGSILERKTVSNGLEFYTESFIDRRYNQLGRLVPRSQPDAVIEDAMGIERQLKEITVNEKVSTIEGNQIDLKADSICIHGDHQGALEHAKLVRKILSAEGIGVKSFLS